MEVKLTWISLLVMMVIVGGFYFLFPRISRRGLLFGVYVGEEASTGEAARRITHSWYLGMAAWFAASFAVSLVSGIMFHSPGGSIFALFLLSIGFLIEYLRAYRRARQITPEIAPRAAAAFIENRTFRISPAALPGHRRWAGRRLLCPRGCLGKLSPFAGDGSDAFRHPWPA